MASKFFKDIQTLRKNVKKLPKKLEDAFTITQSETETKIFVLDEVEYLEKTNEYKITFTEKCNSEKEPLFFDIILSVTEYKENALEKGLVVEKEVYSFVTELCQPLIVIGKILEQNALPEIKHSFVDDIVFDKKISKYKTMSLEEYKNDLISTLTVFKKRVKSL